MGEPNSNDNEMMHGSDMIHGCTEMVHGSEMIYNTELAHGNELVVSAEVTPPTTSRRQKKSAIWGNFTLVDASEGCKRACCNHCKRTFAYSSGLKNVGTSHLTRHIRDSCSVIKDLQESKPALSSARGTDNGDEGIVERPSKRRYRCTGYENASFNQDLSCSYLAKMIILHDYPLHIVQQPAFLSFIESMQPRFKLVDIDTAEKEVYAIYREERDNLQRSHGTMPGRISLTVETWTTSQTLGYVSLAGQFIDSEWKLHRRMLNFLMLPWPRSENALSEAISTSLSGWNMQEKLFTITFDHDCSSHDIYSANLQHHLSNKNILVLKGQLFVLRCYAHILNAVAHDVLASVNSVIYNIRESIKFIKASPSCEGKFAEIVLQLKIPSTKPLCLDVTTEWNTTYLMLLAALDYRQAFTILEISDDNYNEAPLTQDWKKVEAACSYLKLLYDSAHSIMAAANPTANIFFHEAWILKLELSNATAHQDPIFSSIAKGIHERFDKYWKDCNLVLAIAVAMDPRFKMKLVEFAYSKIYGVEAAKYVKVVHDAIHELYKEYVAEPLPLMPTYDEEELTNHGPASENYTPSTPSSTGDGLLHFDIYLSEIVMSQSVNSEIDQYLEEALDPRIPEFDILDWWRLNTLKYPTLSRMARDVLAIPMSTVFSGCSIFSAGTGTGTRMLDDYRSSLRPEIVEALFCGKDWLRYSPTVRKPPSTVSVKME